MRHLNLTCPNHPNLRWSCKSIAFTPGRGYNGARHIFFHGAVDREKLEQECSCPANILVLAPEDEWAELTVEALRAAINAD